MPKIAEGLLKRLRSIGAEYEDQDCITEQDMRLYVWFHEHLRDEILNLGGKERGYTFRQKAEMCLLVYKATFEGLPRVVFVSARVPVHCIHILCRKFYADTLEWVPDKFA